MDQIWRRLRAGASRAPVVLMGGAIVGQLITLSVTPLLARLYSPGDFGQLALVVSVASVAGSVAGLRLESALMLPRDQRDATALLATALLATFITSACLLVVAELAFAVGFLPSFSEIPYFALWASMLTFVTAVFNIASQFALRALKYSIVARRGIHQAAGASLTQVGAWFLWPGGTGLLVGTIVGRVGATIPMIVGMRREVQAFASRRMVQLLRRYWRFPVIFTPSTLLNSLGLVLPLMFVGTWIGVDAAGEWSMAERIMAAPALLVGAAAAQVVESEISRRVRSRSAGLRDYYLRASGMLGVLSIGVALAVLLLADLAVAVFLGTGWDQVATLLRAMVPMATLRIVSVPMSKVLVVLQRASQSLLLDATRVVAILSLMLVSVNTCLDLAQFALLVSLAMAMVYMGTWIYGYRAVMSYDHLLVDRGGHAN